MPSEGNVPVIFGDISVLIILDGCAVSLLVIPEVEALMVAVVCTCRADVVRERVSKTRRQNALELR